jgi:tetratricopeptide (TPR) repeat protein
VYSDGGADVRRAGFLHGRLFGDGARRAEPPGDGSCERVFRSSTARAAVRPCLDVGKDVYTDETQRRAAYEEGARIAKRALDLQDTNAEAHYLYAANLGSAAQLKGLTASALTVRELKRHVTRALELKPDHAPSLHMMGRMLDELPWMLGGDADAALTYLKRAVDADPAYHHARLDLAKAYLKRNDRGSALRELSELIGIDDASSHVADRYQKEGASLLASLQERERPRR